eukprot:2548323-Pleurochrysis_carterae.AAC.1
MVRELVERGHARRRHARMRGTRTREGYMWPRRGGRALGSVCRWQWPCRSTRQDGARCICCKFGAGGCACETWWRSWLPSAHAAGATRCAGRT